MTLGEAAREQIRNLGDSFISGCAYIASTFGLMLLARLRRRLLKRVRDSENLESIQIKGESMEKQIPVGTETKVDIKLANGKLYLIGKYDGADADVDLSLGIEVDLLIDKLAAKIPGAVDDAIFGVLKAALKVI